jgi:cytoskeletal protein CcmA (bactofilin family)
MLGKLSNKKSEGMFTIVKSKNVYVTGSGDGGLYNWKGNISGEKIKMHAKKVQSLVEFEGYVYSGGDDGIVYQWRT